MPPAITPTLTAALATAALEDCGITARVSSLHRLDGGVSNLTWRIALEDGDPVVLRVERERGIFQPYDVLREGRVLSALAGTAVPVPAMLGAAAHSAALGAACIVMEWIDAPHMGQVGISPGLFDAYRAAVDTIHAVDWRAAGLDFLDPPAPGPHAAERDLDTVHARAISFACDADPYITELARAARGALPDSPPPRLCHGDINVFNYLVGDEGAIVGVVDWEQANLGDPLSDWGLICALAALRGSPETPEQMPLARPSLLAGGRPPADLRYWMLHQLYKLAVIHRIWSEIGDIPPWYSWADVQRVGRECLRRLEEGRDLPPQPSAAPPAGGSGEELSR